MNTWYVVEMHGVEGREEERGINERRRGYINSFGVFQAYYSSTLDLPPSTIAWIGSV